MTPAFRFQEKDDCVSKASFGSNSCPTYGCLW
jgi:hypothetical protein